MMARTYSRYGRDQLAELCHDLITEPWDPDGLLGWLQAKRIARTELMEQLLASGSAHVVADSNFQNFRHRPELVDSTFQVYSNMLNHPKYREGAVNYLWGNVHKNQYQWLKAFCAHLDSGALLGLLVTDPSSAARKLSWDPLDRAVAAHVPEAIHGEVISIAAKRRKLAKLFALTGWEACRQHSTGAQRDSILRIDLGL